MTNLPNEESSVDLDSVQFEELGRAPAIGSSLDESHHDIPPIPEPHFRRRCQTHQRELLRQPLDRDSLPE